MNDEIVKDRKNEIEETNEIEIVKSEPEKVKEIARTLKENAVNIVAWKTPNDFIQERKGRGGMTFKYVDVGFIELILNNMYGNRWSFEIVDDKIIRDKHIVVTGKLSIKHEDGTETTHMQYGSSEIKFMTETIQDTKDPKRYKTVQTDKPIDVADDFKAAASDALKKCASMIGIAFDVYHPKTKELLDKFVNRK